MKRFRGELANVYVILFNSLGVALSIHSGLGVSSFSSVPYVFNSIWPFFTNGTWNYIFQFILVCILMILRKKFVPSYFVSFVIAFFLGIFIDLHTLWVSKLPINTFLGIIYFVLGYLLVALGIALSNRSGLPILAVDMFSRDLSEILNIGFPKVKISFDLLCVLITSSLSLIFFGEIIGIGIATLLMALTLGKTAGVIGEALDKHFIFENYKTLRAKQES